MDQLGGLVEAIAARRGITVKSMRRLVLAKERQTLFPRRLAILALALDSKFDVQRVASDEELAQLRAYNRSGDARVESRATNREEPARSAPSRGTREERAGRTVDPAGRIINVYDAMITDPRLRASTRKLFRDKHHSQAIEEGCKLLNNLVKEASGITAKDGADLMHHVFKLEAPVLAINALRKRSERDAQDGYRLLFAGVMTGLRNPRAHEHGIADPPAESLEVLGLINHLLRVFGPLETNR
jgi:uncharacterized protein (TIGR02391 family)